MCLFIYMSVYLFIFLYIYPSIYVYLILYLSIYLSTYISCKTICTLYCELYFDNVDYSASQSSPNIFFNVYEGDKYTIFYTIHWHVDKSYLLFIYSKEKRLPLRNIKTPSFCYTCWRKQEILSMTKAVRKIRTSFRYCFVCITGGCLQSILLCALKVAIMLDKNVLIYLLYSLVMKRKKPFLHIYFSWRW